MNTSGLFPYQVTDYKNQVFRVMAKDNKDAKGQVCRLKGRPVNPTTLMGLTAQRVKESA